MVIYFIFNDTLTSFSASKAAFPSITTYVLLLLFLTLWQDVEWERTRQSYGECYLTFYIDQMDEFS